MSPQSTIQSQDKSPLMQLPPELRNRIYRFAVLSHRNVPVTASGLDEPDLLLTCKQVRKEALGIFYLENTFSIDNQDYDPSVALGWNARLAELRDQRVLVKRTWNTAFSVDSPIPKWSNLIRWLQLVHAGKLVITLGPQETSKDPVKCVIGACMLVARGMQDIPWERCEQVLELQHRVLIILDDRWE